MESRFPVAFLQTTEVGLLPEANSWKFRHPQQNQQHAGVLREHDPLVRSIKNRLAYCVGVPADSLDIRLEMEMAEVVTLSSRQEMAEYHGHDFGG